MTTTPTLALHIPAYNAASFLPRLLQSAADQTEKFDQIWVYNDCSTDSTAEIARAYGAQVLNGDSNVGCSAGKNRLAQHVNTDWIHFHDADDVLYPNFVSLARKWISTNRHDIVLFDYEYRDYETNELLLTRHFDNEDVTRDARSYAIREQINPFCGLYRRSAFLAAGGYDEDPAVLYNEDVAAHIQLAFAGLSFAAEEEISIVNYRRANSMSGANALRCAQAQYEVMRKTLTRPGAEEFGSEIGSRLWFIAASLGAHRDWVNANQAVDLAARLAPPPAAAGSLTFRRLAKISPRAALRFREAWVRLTKPDLRLGLD